IDSPLSRKVARTHSFLPSPFEGEGAGVRGLPFLLPPSHRLAHSSHAHPRPDVSIGDYARPHQPPHPRNLPLPAPARAQPRRLVPLGRGGFRQSPRRGQTDLPLDRLLRL